MIDSFSIQLDLSNHFISKLIQWAHRFSHFCFLDSNADYNLNVNYDFLLGVDVLYSYTDIESLEKNKFYFGHFNYDFKNLSPKTYPHIDFGDCFFFEPRYLIYAKNGRIYFNRNAPESLRILDDILAEEIEHHQIPYIQFKSRTSKEEYLENVLKIQDAIRNGQFYELNYCIDFYNDEANINAIATFLEINQVAKSPMSAILKYNHMYALCFSPERLATLQDKRLVCQPMKGTARRHLEQNEKDLEIKEELRNSLKERAENIMIVDLVRNDMTPYAKTGSIKVEELCHVYTFPFVHQMISTISAELRDLSLSKSALLNLLPAGSMTGAPKIEVIRSIRELENFTRGLYSGNIGYFAPNGDFDFNVVIRSLYYDASRQKISLAVGGAITLLSDAEKEYNECLLKAKGILHFFND